MRVLAWPGSLPEGLLAEFRAETGVEVEVEVVTSNEAFFNRLAAAPSEAAPFDICAPSAVRALDWAASDLLQAWDLGRIDTASNIHPRMLEYAAREWRLGGDAPSWLPYTWGAEAVAWRTDALPPFEQAPSFGDVWRPPADVGAAPGVLVSANSGLVGAGLHLEAVGELEPGSVWASYRSEATMAPVFGRITDWCIERQRELRLVFWNDARTQREQFASGAVSIGQTWDKPVLAMRAEGLPVAFRAPREGALAWQNGFSLTAASQHVDAAHALLAFLCRPEVAGRAIASHGFNSAVVGAEQFASAAYRQEYELAFPGNAVAQLNLWPPEPAWHVERRIAFRDQLVRAVSAV